MGRISGLSRNKNGRKLRRARGRNHLGGKRARGGNHLEAKKARGGNHPEHGEETPSPALYCRRHRGNSRHILEEFLNIEESLNNIEDIESKLFNPRGRKNRNPRAHLEGKRLRGGRTFPGGSPGLLCLIELTAAVARNSHGRR